MPIVMYNFVQMEIFACWRLIAGIILTRVHVAEI